MDDQPSSSQPSSSERQHISAQDARGGEIILRSRRRRIIFIAGLVGLALVAILLRMSAWI